MEAERHAQIRSGFRLAHHCPATNLLSNSYRGFYRAAIPCHPTVGVCYPDKLKILSLSSVCSDVIHLAGSSGPDWKSGQPRGIRDIKCDRAVLGYRFVSEDVLMFKGRLSTIEMFKGEAEYHRARWRWDDQRLWVRFG